MLSTSEIKLQNRIADLNVTLAFIAALDGCISASRLSLAFSGQRNLALKDYERLEQLTRQLLELRDSFLPVPLALTSASDIRWLMDHTSPEKIRTALSGLFQPRD